MLQVFPMMEVHHPHSLTQDLITKHEQPSQFHW